MLDGHTGIRLMNDYAAVWPLWWSDGGQIPEHALPLSAALTRDLFAWAEHFEAHFSYETGWDAPESRAAHADRADRLVADLRRELDGLLDVEPHLWELDA